MLTSPSSVLSKTLLLTAPCMHLLIMTIISRSRSIYSRLSRSPSPQTFSPGKPPAPKNPYIQRITTIRETVTKNARVGSVASRLKKCLTRTSLFSIHCWMAVILSVVLGIFYRDIPCTRDGIEDRESLFHVIVRINKGMVFLFLGESSYYDFQRTMNVHLFTFSAPSRC